VSAHTAAAITRLLPLYLDSKAYHVVNGAVGETTELLAQAFDFIMYVMRLISLCTFYQQCF